MLYQGKIEYKIIARGNNVEVILEENDFLSSRIVGCHIVEALLILEQELLKQGKKPGEMIDHLRFTEQIIRDLKKKYISVLRDDEKDRFN